MTIKGERLKVQGEGWDASNTIRRPEIAERLGISITMLVNVIRHSDARPPAPLGFRAKMLIYERVTMLAWIDSKPLVGLRWEQFGRSEAPPKLDGVNLRRFLAGDFDPPKCQRRHLERVIAARRSRPATRRIELRPKEEFDKSTNYWEGLP